MCRISDSLPAVSVLSFGTLELNYIPTLSTSNHRVKPTLCICSSAWEQGQGGSPGLLHFPALSARSPVQRPSSDPPLWSLRAAGLGAAAAAPGGAAQPPAMGRARASCAAPLPPADMMTVPYSFCICPKRPCGCAVVARCRVCYASLRMLWGHVSERGASRTWQDPRPRCPVSGFEREIARQLGQVSPPRNARSLQKGAWEGTSPSVGNRVLAPGGQSKPARPGGRRWHRCRGPGTPPHRETRPASPFGSSPGVLTALRSWTKYLTHNPLRTTYYFARC